MASNSNGGKMRMCPRVLIVVAFCAAALAGCSREEGTARDKQKQAAAPASGCCQCSGKTNPNPPPAYTLNPDCNPTGWTNTTCDPVCASLGHSSGAIFKGACKAAPSGNGNTCQ